MSHGLDAGEQRLALEPVHQRLRGRPMIGSLGLAMDGRLRAGGVNTQARVRESNALHLAAQQFARRLAGLVNSETDAGGTPVEREDVRHAPSLTHEYVEIKHPTRSVDSLCFALAVSVWGSRGWRCRMYGIKPVATVLLVLAATPGMTQEHQHGHAESLGEVRFATSCNEAAQGEFNRAVALLHSFQFSRAIEGFNRVLTQDPACAIAYWGISLSNWSNPFSPGIKDTAQLRLGRENTDRGKALGAKTQRERDYIAAVGLLYGNFESTPQQPTHPGLAHYIIHAYDVPALAGRALAAARRYAQIAPDAPHALHMPSHTFTRLGLWQESIDSNVAAAAAARRQGQTAEELHASDYETYAYLQTAQDAAAARIVNSLPLFASRFDPKAVQTGAGPPTAAYFALAAIPARFALERQDWQQAEQLALRQTPFPYTDAMTWFGRGMG